MPEHLRPADAHQLRDVIAWAAAETAPLELVGAGSKRALGRPSACPHLLDLSALVGVTLYEPDELVLGAKAATPLAEIETVLAQHRQQLAFEPADLGPLLGQPPSRGTIGGAVACNLSGPRRFKAGAARDHVLGVKAVSGRGEEFKTGGRVVKNVTGYDLSKLLTGSFGTLAAMTEVTVKVMPAAEKTRTILVTGLGDGEAIEVLGRAARTRYDVSGLAHLPTAVTARSAVSYLSEAGAAVTAMRLEGAGPSVVYRGDRLRPLFTELGPVEELHSHNSATFWCEVRDVARLLALDEAPERVVWRLSVPPAAGAEVVQPILACCGGEGYYDWAGGLVWLALDPTADAAGGLVRAAAERAGGSALLVRAAADVRTEVPVFPPEPASLAALTRRIKENFDPRRILNPGRMYAGV